MNDKPKLLLHICCAPCATHVVEALRKDHQVIGFFYNPNIQPAKEYYRRLSETRRLFRSLGIELIEGEYEESRWWKEISGFEKEPEGGRRCPLCYRLRLGETARLAKETGISHFATTLTISPHKKAGVINPIGEEVGKSYKVSFFSADFKKKNGFKKTLTLSKKHNLYRQDYCGCLPSLFAREKRKKEKG
jgi:predicted adenine nucleotide alpha hydrolase (AANH) superfamily ATPase